LNRPVYAGWNFFGFILSKTEKLAQEQVLSRKSRAELLRFMNNKAKVVTNPALL
jgi:hypothetical protein